MGLKRSLVQIQSPRPLLFESAERAASADSVSIAALRRRFPETCERRHARPIQRQPAFADGVVVDPAERVEKLALLLELRARHLRGADVGAESDAVTRQELVRAEESVARSVDGHARFRGV